MLCYRQDGPLPFPLVCLLVCVANLLPRFPTSAGRWNLIWGDCDTSPVPHPAPSHPRRRQRCVGYNLTNS